MKYLIEIAKKNKLLVIIYLLSGVLIAFLNSFNANYFQRLIDRFNEGSLTIANIIIYALALVVLSILNYLDEYPKHSLEHGIYIDLKLKALEKISRIDYQIYQSMGTGKLIQRIENGATAGKSILYDFILRIIRELFPSILFSMIFIYHINKGIMLIILIGYIVVFFTTKLLLKVLYQIKEGILSNEEVMNHILVRGFMEMVVFRINKRFKHEIEKAEQARKDIVKSKVKMKLIHESFFTIFALLVIIIKIFIMTFGWLTNSLSIGAIIALITLIDNAYIPIAIFNVLFVQYKLDNTAFKRYTDFLGVNEDEQLDKGYKVTVLKADILFNDIKFTYDNRIILDRFNLYIRNGEKVALVGESGSGKSTLIKLITGLLKPQSGMITIGTHDLQSLNLNCYYDNIAYISQETPIFDGTLRENLVFDKKVDNNELIKALEQVELLELYNKLEDGLDTELGERATTLSGGERQRLALARLWFSHADIVLLDEATSAMDNITEELIMNRLMDLLQEKTVITIAHRLNSIRKYEHIVVLKDGCIVDQGSFDELMKRNSYFRDLYLASSV